MCSFGSNQIATVHIFHDNAVYRDDAGNDDCSGALLLIVILIVIHVLLDPT